MSTHYFVACADCCRVCPAAATRGERQTASSLVGDEWLRAFLVAHAGHKLECISEHDDRASSSWGNCDDDPNEEERRRGGT